MNSLFRKLNFVLAIKELRRFKFKKHVYHESNSKDNTISNMPKESSFANISELVVSFKGKELVPTQALVSLNSAKVGVPLFVVHPGEGIADALVPLSQTLHCPVHGFQCTKDAPMGSIEELAAWYWSHVKKLTLANGIKSVNLAGYSFGAAVAFEMGLQAQLGDQHPNVKDLFMLDGSHALGAALFHHSQDQSKIEVQCLSLFLKLLVKGSASEWGKELLKLETSSERREWTTEKILRARPELGHADVTTAFDLFYKRVLMSIKYVPKFRLKREISLIKASESARVTKSVSAYYDLEKVCDGPIKVHTIPGTHQTFIWGNGAKEVAKIIGTI